jgi:hypothetical protein
LGQEPPILNEILQGNCLLEGVRFLNPLTAEFDLTAWV